MATTYRNTQQTQIDEEQAYNDVERAAVAAYRASISTDVKDVAKRLQELLSAGVAAYVAGVKSSRSVTRWANGETAIQPESEKRLRVAYEIVQLLANYDSEKIVRAWFLGINPHLDDLSPADAIHNGNLKEARAAAYEFAVGG